MNRLDKGAVKFFLDLKKKDKFVILICLSALLVLLLSSKFTALNNTKSASKSNSTTAATYKAALEKQLGETLSGVQGVGKVSVMITLEGEITQTPVFNENTSGSSSSDTSNKSSNQTSKSKDAVMVKDAAGTFPYTVSDKYPDIVGVIIVAEGADNISVKSYIVNAVKTSLGVSSHKITVLPKE